MESDNRKFSLQMAVERCRGIPGFNNESVVDMADMFYQYLTKDNQVDTPKSAPYRSRGRPPGKKGK